MFFCEHYKTCLKALLLRNQTVTLTVDEWRQIDELIKIQHLEMFGVPPQESPHKPLRPPTIQVNIPNFRSTAV